MRNPFMFLSRSNHSLLTDSTQRVFYQLFPRAINVEWTIGKRVDEAIFYQDGKEWIACFAKSSSLIEYRVNHDITDLPNHIELAARHYGEIMNAISIHNHDVKTEAEYYEIIFRTNDLIRFSLLLNGKGETLSVSKL